MDFFTFYCVIVTILNGRFFKKKPVYKIPREVQNLNVW